LYGESGASTNGVRRASGCGHEILEVAIGGHSGAQVPLWGRQDGGRGAGRVRHARGIVMEAGPACNVLGTKGLRTGGL
jgi:hypothetical protein